MDKLMMNRYITALLVVLTATGIEAQAYQSALKAARGGDVALEELCRQTAFQGKEAEIRCIIKAIKDVQECDEQASTHVSWSVQASDEVLWGFVARQSLLPTRCTVALLSPAFTTAIQIRAPSC